MSDRKRQQLKERVSKGEARLRERQTLAERAAQARDSAVEFAKENPMLVIVGGIALGAAVSLLFRRSPTRKAAEQGAKKANKLFWFAAELALPFVQQALVSASEAGRDGLGKLEGFGEVAGDRARSLGKSAASRADDTIESARGAGKRAFRALRSRAH